MCEWNIFTQQQMQGFFFKQNYCKMKNAKFPEP
jgi:hypothetical protein